MEVSKKGNLSMGNVIAVITILVLVVGGLVAFYMTNMVGGVIVGKTSNVVQSGNINVSTAMKTHLSGQEADFISVSDTNSETLKTVVQIGAIVALVVLFGMGAIFGYRKAKEKGYIGGGSSSGGMQ